MTRCRAWMSGFFLLFMAAPAWSETVVVFAAASLKGALDEAVDAYAGDVVVSYGGSGQIARQLAHGAPANIVLLAHDVWMDWLQEQGVILDSSRKPLWRNRLVLIGAEGVALDVLTDRGLRKALAGGRMAVGQVRSVPAGIYAKEWLETIGLWPSVRDHIAETENVRAALTLVARGEAPLGIVYATDLRAAKVTLLHEVDPAKHSPILYSVALVHSKGTPEAADFLTYLENDPQDVFARHGFLGAGGS